MPEHTPSPTAAETYDLTVTRILAAPVDAVWRAWSDPDAVRQWWGPAGFTCTVADLDFREGGVSLVGMRAPAEYGGQELHNTWSYGQIVPGERIAFDLRFADAQGTALDPADLGIPPDVPARVPHLVTLRAAGDDATELTVTERGYTSEAARQQSKVGLDQCLDKMAALLATPTAPSPDENGSTTTVDMKLELVPIPVTDVDRAKAFYVEKVGFVEDLDARPTDTMRVVQLTPPGSACSIVIGTDLGRISEMPPGAIRGPHLVVDDIDAARAGLAARGVDVSEVEDSGGGVRYAYFSDPDGNLWVLQEMAWRTGDRF